MEWRLKKRYIFSAFLILLSAFFISYFFYLSYPKPIGDQNKHSIKEANKIAKAIEQAIHKSDWNRTNVLTWTFLNHTKHIWDKQRGYSQVVWSDEDYRAQFLIQSPQKGIVFYKNKQLYGKKKQKYLKKAYNSWKNDSFWLNPFVQLFDKNAKRMITRFLGQKALMIQYVKSDKSLGDAYVYLLNSKNLPTKCHMWVSNVPIKGLSATFDKWITLSTNAKVSIHHKIGFFILKLKNVQGFHSIQELSKSDPFILLENYLKSKKINANNLQK